VARLPASEPSEDLPTAETIIKAIALAKGKLRGHEYFLTKTEIILVCEQWLTEKMLKRRARSSCVCFRSVPGYRARRLR
jgi:hypothetical protein